MRSRFCVECGSPSATGDHFCRSCGISLDSRATTALLLPPDAPTGNGHAVVPPEPAASSTGSRRRWARHWAALVGAAAIVVVAGGVAAFVLLRSGDSSRTSTRTQLRAGAAHAQPALTRALGATRLEDLHTTASLAEDAQQPMATVVGAASTIPNVRYRTVAESALRAERSYVSDLARLSGLSTRDLSGWDATKTALQRDALALSAARPRVSSLQLRGAGPLLIAPEDASRAVAAIDRVVRRAERLLRSWSIDVRHVRAHNRQAVETVTSYAATMRGYLGSYDKLRGDTSAWITKVDTDGETFDHAYQFLDDAIASRQTLKDSLGGLRAPTPALAAAQSQLTHTLGDSIQAMSDAESGISDYQFSLDYTNYKETPGWSQFEKASDSVAGEYASARAEWEAQVAKRLKTVRSRGLPPRPSV